MPQVKLLISVRNEILLHAQLYEVKSASVMWFFN
jgi:hypothetical protein